MVSSISTAASVIAGIAKLIEGGFKFGGGLIAAPATGGLSLAVSASGAGDVALGAGLLAVGDISYNIASTSGNEANKDRSKLEGAGKSKPTVNYQGKEVPVYRGGKDFKVKPNEVKVGGKTGLLKDTHGVSVDVNPDTVSKFGGAYKIDSLPDGLKIIQRGLRSEHFEIVPSTPMTLEEFQQLLSLIEISPI